MDSRDSRHSSKETIPHLVNLKQMECRRSDLANIAQDIVRARELLAINLEDRDRAQRSLRLELN